MGQMVLIGPASGEMLDKMPSRVPFQHQVICDSVYVGQESSYGFVVVTAQEKAAVLVHMTRDQWGRYYFQFILL